MRLIDADGFKEYIDCGHLRPPTELCFSEADVVNMIDKQPTVEQKHGHWEISAYCNHKPYRLRHADKWTIWRCSVCGENNGRCHSDAYCRHCGAKMDEVTE